jgi:hypothetical protein
MAVPSAEKLLRSRLLPQISFKNGLIGVTLTVFLAWMGRLALQGSMFPKVLLLSIGSLIILQAVWSLLFVIAWLPAAFGKIKTDEGREGSPFAANQLPPQIMPPKGQP